MTRRRRRILTLIILIVLIPTIIVGSDFAARYWLLVNEPPTLSQFRVGRPAAYRNSVYFSPEFTDEQGRFAQAWILDDAGFWKNDFHGKWYNHSDRERLTMGQPTDAANTLYLFGSSTTLNSEVPDGYTIASYLQRDIGSRYRVVNLGASGMDIESQYLLLRTLTLHEEDTVIFYDGIADASSGFKSPIQGRDALLSGKICDWLSGKLGGLGVVQMYCALTDRALPSHQTPNGNQVPDRFVAMLNKTYALCQARGVVFYHFLQPTIWSKSPSAYEQILLSNHNLTPIGIGDYVAKLWPELQAASIRFPGADLTHSLDALRASGSDIYLDYDHTTERGNQVVAQAIYNTIWRTF